jgi:hypothetical protein
MWNTSVRFARLWGFQSAVVFGAILSILLLPMALKAQSGSTVMKVEEDWELVLVEPSPEVAAPQVTCSISPLGNVDGVYAALELNHGTLPSYTAGGLQLQAWNGESWLTVRDYDNTTLHHSGEVVTWTSRMVLSGGLLTFRVANGSSTSWGAFGSGGNIKLSLVSTLSNLNAYSPDLSAAHSGIGFGSQRVQSLKLKQVRYYDGSGNLLSTDTTPRVVHQQ